MLLFITFEYRVAVVWVGIYGRNRVGVRWEFGFRANFSGVKSAFYNHLFSNYFSYSVKKLCKRFRILARCLRVIHISFDLCRNVHIDSQKGTYCTGKWGKREQKLNFFHSLSEVSRPFVLNVGNQDLHINACQNFTKLFFKRKVHIF